MKGFSKHGELHNPYAFGYFEHAPHADFRGGHVTIGGVVYQGHALPAALRNQYVAANVLSNAIYWHHIDDRGSTFANRFGGELLQANDQWFRPVDLTVGPNGAVYIADWHDKRANHVDPKDDWDKSTGRVYVLSADGAPAFTPDDLSKRSTNELVDLLIDANQWKRREALRLLGDRQDGSVAPRLYEQAATAVEPAAALAGVWGLAVLNQVNDDRVEKLLASPHAEVRAWAVRLAGDAGAVATRTAARLAEMAAVEPAVTVRCQLACSAKRLPGWQSLPIVENLLQRSEDAADPFLPLLLWWNVEAKAASDRAAVLAMLKKPAVFSLPLVQDVVLQRLARRYAAAGSTEDWASVADLLNRAASFGGTAVDKVTAGVVEALPGRCLAAVPAPMQPALDELWGA
ncbi:MAG: DUF7133 domain-containing protein, partial [Planctomycetia bacterium]